MKRSVLVFCSSVILGVALLGAKASAMTTKIVPPPKGAPIALRECTVTSVESTKIYDIKVSITDLDVEKPFERVRIKLQFFDDAKAPLSEVVTTYRKIRVLPGETKPFSNAELLSTAADAASAECSVMSVTFDGGAIWLPSMTSPSPKK